MKKLFAILLAMALLTTCAAEGEKGMTGYQSDFSTGTDGWVARSMGTAALTVTEEGTLRITGRADDWNSPGRDFALTPGVAYQLSVQVYQDEVEEARFMISVAHTAGGVESYENLGAGTAAKGEWTTLTGSYSAGVFDRFVLYVETTGTPTLSYEIRDFVVEGQLTAFGEEELPALCEVYADKFDFGTAITASEAVNAERMAFCAQQFSILTPGNELKPDFVLDVATSRVLSARDDTAVAVHFDAAKPLLDYAKENGLKVHGHVLVWHSQTPEAFFHQGYDTGRPLVSREVMLARLESYIQQIMAYMDENYPGVIVSWDVVNEAIDDGTGKLRASNWLTVVGEDFLARAFELARKYAPEGTQLYYNDYNTAILLKQNGIMELLNELMAEGNIDGYGFQMHHDLAFPSVQQIAASVQRVAATGLKLRVSELDITVPDNSEATFEKQAAMYGDILRLLLPYSDQLEAVQVWGVTDDMSWRASGYPLLFDAKGHAKPAFWAVVEAAGE